MDSLSDAELSDDSLDVVVAILLVLLGIGLLAHPLYLWPHYGQTQHVLVVQQESNQPDTFVEFDTLSPEAQAAFREAVSDGQHVLWSGEDDRAIDRFQDSPTIRYDGEYYRTGFQHGVTLDFTETLLRWYGTAVGAFLLAFGVLVLYFGSWRPLTPLRSLLVTAAVSIAFLATNAYDVLFSGVEGPILGIAKLGILELIPVTTLFLAIGSEVVRNGRQSRAAIGGTVGIVLLTLLINAPAFQIVVVLIVIVFGLPWFGLGYRLTDAD